MAGGGPAGGRPGNAQGSPPPCAQPCGPGRMRLPPPQVAPGSGVTLRLIFQQAARAWGAPGDGTRRSPAWLLGEGAGRVPASGGAGAAPGRESRGRWVGGPPGRGAPAPPAPAGRCSCCLGLPPAAGDASLGRLLVPPPGCADTWDATSLGSWNSELIPLGLDLEAPGPSAGRASPETCAGVGGLVGRAFLTPGAGSKKPEGGRERGQGGREGETGCTCELPSPGPN